MSLIERLERELSAEEDVIALEDLGKIAAQNLARDFEIAILLCDEDRRMEELITANSVN